MCKQRDVIYKKRRNLYEQLFSIKEDNNQKQHLKEEIDKLSKEYNDIRKSLPSPMNGAGVEITKKKYSDKLYKEIFIPTNKKVENIFQTAKNLYLDDIQRNQNNNKTNASLTSTTSVKHISSTSTNRYTNNSNVNKEEVKADRGRKNNALAVAGIAAAGAGAGALALHSYRNKKKKKSNNSLFANNKKKKKKSWF